MDVRRAALLLAALALGCSSLEPVVVNRVGSALANGDSVYASDNDPELVWQAVPFGLKTIEGLLAKSPKNKDLLLAEASGYTAYAHGALEAEADFIEAKDLARATELRRRARNLYLRAVDYGLRGLEVDLPDLRNRLHQDAPAALATAGWGLVPLLYWTGAAWGSAISISKDDPELSADLPAVEALERRALALDETYQDGAIHEFFIAYEGARSTVGGSLVAARQHFDRAVALSHGQSASAYVTYAEVVMVAQQDKKGFTDMLEQALKIDPNKTPAERLANVLAQRRAHWLLGRTDELFVD
jgi:predicted anti-sigma-YlaC factor YlaD